MRGASSRAQCVHDTTPRCSRQALRASNNKEHTRYDDNGNTLTKTPISDGQKYEFAWDYRNRLTQVLLKNSGGTILQQTDYTYDAFNRRIIKVHDPDGPGSESATTTKTIYDGASFAANPYADFDGSNALTMRYVYGPLVDMLLARRDALGTVAWQLADHLNTVRDVVSTVGSVLDHVSYSAFGTVTAESAPSNGGRFKFTGREYETETSTYYYRSRFYDGATGRFSSTDLLSFRAGDTNLYRYVRNSPTYAVDPTGHSGWFGPGVNRPVRPLADPFPWRGLLSGHSDDEKRLLNECKGNPACLQEMKDLFRLLTTCESAPYDPVGGPCITFANALGDELEKRKFEYLTYERQQMYYEWSHHFGIAFPRWRYFIPVAHGMSDGHVWHKFEICTEGEDCYTFYVDAGWTNGGNLTGNHGGPDHIFFNPPAPPPQWPVWPGDESGKDYVCFAAGTTVETSDGPKLIESIASGDLVLGFDLVMGRVVTTKVIELEVHRGAFELMEVQVNEEDAIRVTRGHPFMTRSGWVWSENLAKSEELLTRKSDFVRIDPGGWTLNESIAVYNVRTEHGTYFVGDAAILVSGRRKGE